MLASRVINIFYRFARRVKVIDELFDTLYTVLDWYYIIGGISVKTLKKLNSSPTNLKCSTQT